MGKNDSRTLKLQKWINKNYEDWRTICGMGKFPISEEEFMRLGETLVGIGFEEITLVLLQCHSYAVQDRMGKNIRAAVKIYKDKLRRRGLDPDELLRALDGK